MIVNKAQLGAGYVILNNNFLYSSGIIYVNLVKYIKNKDCFLYECPIG